MSIDLSNFDVFSLPSTSLEETRKLPNKSGIYFVVDSDHQVAYIGKSVNLKARFQGHDKRKLFKKLPSPSFVYFLSVDNFKTLDSAEIDLIKLLQPRLNLSTSQSRTKGKDELVPIVKDGWVVGEKIKVGTPQWVEWLDNAKSFRLESPEGTFTARRKGGKYRYWYAERRIRGKVFSLYVKKANQKNWEELVAIAKELDKLVSEERENIGELTPQERQIQMLQDELAKVKAENAKLRRQLKAAA